MSKPVLEPAAQEIADATSKPPLLYELGPDGARNVLDDVQAAPIDKPDVEEKWITVRTEVGDVRVRIVKPVGATGSLPTVLYGHGGGWILGNAATHDRLITTCCVTRGRAYARRLVEAGVPTTSVRYNGATHDFMMFNPVRGIDAATGAVEQAIAVLRMALGHDY